MRREKVSCIIPARNEAERIGNVLSAVHKHSLIDEIIVVQNFSTDNTSQVVRDFIKKNKARNIKLLEVGKYPGKAYALYYGVEKSKFPLLLFLDSDLKGLTKENINDLLLPLMKNKADATISLRGDSLTLYKLFKVDPISGERAIKKELFLKMPDCRYYGFSTHYFNNNHQLCVIEALLNDFLIESNRRIKIVKMYNVRHAMKHRKMGFLEGWRQEMKMVRNLFTVISLTKFIRQLMFLHRNAIRD